MQLYHKHNLAREGRLYDGHNLPATAAGLSLPVTNAGGAANGTASVESFGVDIPLLNDFWVQWTMNMSDTNAFVPVITMRKGGSTGTFVAGLAMSGANNGIGLRLATGALSASYPYGMSTTQLVGDAGTPYNVDIVCTAHVVLNDAAANLLVHMSGADGTAVANTAAGLLDNPVDWLGFCNPGSGTCTYSAITVASSDPRL